MGAPVVTDLQATLDQAERLGGKTIPVLAMPRGEQR
jgi:hypothetical protein